MFCKECGVQLPDDARFCDRCGCPVEIETSGKPMDWVDRTVDDLFFALVNGRIGESEEILRNQPELLTESVEIDDEEKGTTTYTVVLFSVLWEMHNEGINRDSLDVMSAAGQDFNHCVHIAFPNMRHSNRPILFYTIMWNDPELTEYLLEHGADPNAMTDDDTESEYCKSTYITMLKYAITDCQGTEMMKLLLSYGADPRKYSEPFVEGTHMVNQKILPMYYSVVDMNSPEKTACLLQYGASPQDMIDVGFGFMHRNSFYQYLKMLYPKKTVVVDLALKQLEKLPVPQVNYVYSSMHSSPQSVPVGDQQPASGFINQRVSGNINKKCYNKFVAYLFANFSLLTLCFGIIGPFIMLLKGDQAAAFGCFLIGVPCLLISAMIGIMVYKAGKARGQTHFYGEFIFDSIVIWIKVFMVMTIILIPFVSCIVSEGEWTERKTVDGLNVTVKDVGGGEYKDALGNKYRKVKKT